MWGSQMVAVIVELNHTQGFWSQHNSLCWHGSSMSGWLRADYLLITPNWEIWACKFLLYSSLLVFSLILVYTGTSLIEGWCVPLVVKWMFLAQAELGYLQIASYLTVSWSYPLLNFISALMTILVPLNEHGTMVWNSKKNRNTLFFHYWISLPILNPFQLLRHANLVLYILLTFAFDEWSHPT